MSEPQPIAAGNIAFHAFYTPRIEAGVYTVEACQTLDVPDAAIPPISQDFEVVAPRFGLDGAAVHARYPPAHSSGDYADALPFVVLNDRMLPWARTLDASGALPPQTALPWMALLVFADGELAGDPTPSGTYTQTGTVADLLAGDDTTLAPALTPPPDDPNQLCGYVEVSGSAFLAVAPTVRELPYLAHVRAINTGDTAILDHAEAGWFSVVMSNRFPNPPDGSENGLRNVAHLVSLEGFEAYLDQNPTALPTRPDGTTPKNIRLVSLASWVFTCTPHAGQSFAGLVTGLTGEASGTAYPADALRLRLPVTGLSLDPLVATRLERGYVALPYHSLSGEDSFAWYRGPLTPAPMPPQAKPTPFLSVSQAMMYDETYGVFDHSLAAAWQLGRTLALADRGFASDLLTFRREGRALLTAVVAAGGEADVLTARKPHRAARMARTPHTTPLLSLDTLRTLGEAVKRRPRHTRSEARSAAPEAARPRPVAMRKTALMQTDVQGALGTEAQALIAPVAAWIGEANLLYDLPFNHLVPDPAMLPPESIRFFYLDENWLDAFADGALSLALQSGLDAALQTALRDAIRAATPTPARAGFLLRSALASGWPGLQIQATQGGNTVAALRMDHLAPDVMLCLYPEVPDALRFSVPHESLTFGLLADGKIDLRELVTSIGTPDRGTLDIDYEGSPYFRDAAHRVLRLDDWASDPAQYLIQQMNTLLGASLTSATFAIEMVQSPEYATFTLPS